MIDYLSDDDGDLMIQNGDFVKGDSGIGHMKILLNSSKGTLRENPLVGVFPTDYLESDDISGLLRETRKELVKDGATLNSIKEDEGKIKINAYYP